MGQLDSAFPLTWDYMLPARDIINVTAALVDGIIKPEATDGYVTKVKNYNGNMATVESFNGLSEPSGIAVDSAGNVFVTELRANRVSWIGNPPWRPFAPLVLSF